MPDLPVRPDIDQLRHQARELLRVARAGDSGAIARLRAVSEQLTLTAARLALAREYGFASWAGLKTEVEARRMDLAGNAEAFCEASIRDWTGRAARMLAETPEIAGYSFATAVILGDAARVREELRRDPAAVTRPDARWGFTPLHAVCASRWHRLDPDRADGLLAVARLLLDAGADPAAPADGRPGDSPLRCSVAGAANPAITRLLLERGAVPDDHDLYLACFGGDHHESLRLLLDHVPDAAETTALAAPISTGDTEGVRLLLEAGADPRRLPPADLYGARHAGHPPWPAVYAAVRSGCPAELVRLLLDHDAGPDAPGPDGRSPYRVAITAGRDDLAALLSQYGARDDATETERLVSACLRADEGAVRGLLAADPGLPGRMTEAELGGAAALAAQTGGTAALRLMLDAGFPVNARDGDDGGTPLHAAAYSGSAGAVRFLLDRGADLEARDTTWDSAPLIWAMVGSGEQPGDDADADWVATVRILLEAGASTQGIALSPDDIKPPSPQVAGLLRSYGIGGEHPGNEG
jgi:ankyrin repeat protein